MKQLYIYTIGLAALLISLASCTNEGTPDILETEKGTFQLHLEVNTTPEIIITRSGLDEDKFWVSITKENDSVFYGQYEELKALGTLELETGRYSVSVQESQDELPDLSDKARYRGEDNFDIFAGSITVTTVACKMENMKIKLDLSAVVSYFDESTLQASIQFGEEGEIYQFTIDDDGLTEDYYFRPSTDLRLIIEGAVNGKEMGTLATYPLPADKINAHTYLILVITAYNADVRANNNRLFQIQAITHP